MGRARGHPSVPGLTGDANRAVRLRCRRPQDAAPLERVRQGGLRPRVSHTHTQGGPCQATSTNTVMTS